MPDRTHARTRGTTRNDFPVGLTPPTSDLWYVRLLTDNPQEFIDYPWIIHRYPWSTHGPWMIQTKRKGGGGVTFFSFLFMCWHLWAISGRLWGSLEGLWDQSKTLCNRSPVSICLISHWSNWESSETILKYCWNLQGPVQERKVRWQTMEAFLPICWAFIYLFHVLYSFECCFNVPHNHT